MNTPFFEIRMPTYNRPDLLSRAVKSLLQQTYPHWKAVVFDDSTEDAARAIVQNVSDDRITYQKNQNRMGAAGNIDQCFSPQPLFSGHYGCLLEDDNYWLPDFLAELAKAMTASNSLVLANQRINDYGNGLLGEESTTRGDWFSDGLVSPLYLHGSLLLMEGISNGGLVWRLDDRLDLRVGPTVKEAGLQEACRSLLIDTPFLFVSRASAVWTSMPQSDTARAQDTYRSFGRGMQAIRSFVLGRHGRAVVDMARSIAQKRGLNARLLEVLSYSGYPHLAGELIGEGVSIACRGVAKGLAIRVVQKNPCGSFIQSLVERRAASGC